VRTSGLLAGVRAVAFDAVGTLITPDPPVESIYRAVGQRHGSQLTADVIRGRFSAAFRTEDERDRAAGWRTGRAREIDRWRHIVSAVLDDVSDPETCFHELWDHFSRPTSWHCLPDVGAVLNEMSNLGVTFGLASNFDSRLRTVAAGLPDLASIGPIVVSAEVGWRKPAPEFFAAVVRTFDRPPNEILLVGDDFENDYVGATAAGLKAVLLSAIGRSAIACIRELADLVSCSVRPQVNV
jgi:putative hydrolase of the HAD superfamily